MRLNKVDSEYEGGINDDEFLKQTEPSNKTKTVVVFGGFAFYFTVIFIFSNSMKSEQAQLTELDKTLPEVRAFMNLNMTYYWVEVILLFLTTLHLHVKQLEAISFLNLIICAIL